MTVTRRPSDADRAYTYLACLPLKTLRNFCRELHVKQKGVKIVVVERVFVTMGHSGSRSEYPWDVFARELSRKCNSRSYDDWINDNLDRENQMHLTTFVMN